MIELSGILDSIKKSWDSIKSAIKLVIFFTVFIALLAYLIPKLSGLSPSMSYLFVIALAMVILAIKVTGQDVNKYLLASLVAGLIIGIALMEVYLTPLQSPIALLVIIALAMMIPETYDIFLAYLNKDKDGNPTGIDGLGRVLMAFGIILVIAAAAFQLMTITSTSLETLPTNFSSLGPQLISLNTTSNISAQAEMDKMIDIVSKNNQAIIDRNKDFVDTIKTILTTLGGAITTIIGFYFGQRAAESKGGEKKEKPDKPILNNIIPSHGSVGKKVTLSGTNFGSSQGGSYVKFGPKNLLESLEDWSTTRIEVKVPDLTNGKINVAVFVNGVASDEKEFTVE